MAKQTQLEFIRDLAQSREHQLAAEVGELRRQKTSAEVALNRLDTYLAEYTAEVPRDSTDPGRSVTQVVNERRFVKRLSRAVEQQRARTRQCGERVNLKLKTWQRERAQVEALERVVEQRRMAAEHKQMRHEQSEADAISGYRVALKLRSGNI